MRNTNPDILFKNILRNVALVKSEKKVINTFPEKPGIYFFIKNNKPIYIGKSKNIKTRITSYFYTNLNEKTANMIIESEKLGYVLVGSELESLLLEAKLVGLLKPKYNIQLKDDKHPLYIIITKEEFPRVTTGRKKDLSSSVDFFGPFPSTTNVKYVLKTLRKIFPFSQHKVGKRACLYSQIKLCYPCPSAIANEKDPETSKKMKSEYLKNIKTVKRILEGKITTVQNNLQKSMLKKSKQLKYEEALNIKMKLTKLNYITQPITPAKEFIKNPNLIEDIRQQEIKNLKKILSVYIDFPKNIKRIECYDIAHLAGTNPTASMVTFIDGEPEKNLYRHFRINQKKGSSDTDSLEEAGKRRMKYISSWGIPDLIIVDGGKGQVNTFRKIFEPEKIPVIGLSKRNEKLIIPIKDDELSTNTFIEIKLPRTPAKNLVQRMRDEAHRFARRYHHLLLKRSLIPQKG